MGDFIIKPKSDEDFYVVYSTVVDTPTGFGSREQLERDYQYAAPDRFARADEFGSSAKVGNPPWYGWQEQTITVREGIEDPTRPEGASGASGTVRREDLRAFCESLKKGFFCPAPGIVTWGEED